MEIKINIDDQGKLTSACNQPVRIDDLMTILFTVQLNTMQTFLKSLENQATPEQIKTVKEDLYDKYNAGASNLLYLLIPDKELRPDLTVEAMKEAEDRYMYNQLNRKARREVDKKTKGESKILRFPDNHIPHVD